MSTIMYETAVAVSQTGTEPSDATNGAVIRAMREAVGMSQRALAAGAECSNQHLGYIEAGQRPLTYDLAHRIAIAIANHINHLNRRVAA